MAPARPILVRIPFSPYCRKAEWALTLVGIEYDTWDVLPNGTLKLPTEAQTVPLLLVPGAGPNHGDLLIDGSRPILDWAEGQRPGILFPKGKRRAVDAWQEWADDELGPAARRETYRVAYSHPGKLDVPLWAKAFAMVGRSWILAVLKYFYARRHEAADAEFFPAAIARLGTALRDRAYLVGDAPTASDISVAAALQTLGYSARARGLHQHADWAKVAAFMHRVLPARTTRRRKRWLRRRDLARLTTAAPPRAGPGAKVARLHGAASPD